MHPSQDKKGWQADIETMKSQPENPPSEEVITKEQSVAELEILLDRYEWFHSAGVDGNRVVVYVNEMTTDILRTIHDPFYGHNVVVAFASYLLCAEKYGTGGSGKSVLKQYVASGE